MSIVELEREIDHLPYGDRLLLIERIVRNLRQITSSEKEIWRQQLAEMAADPDIQREIRAINEELR